MGWGWCSGTVLCGDLAISRGVDVSFLSWDALLDRRLPVGTGHLVSALEKHLWAMLPAVPESLASL